MEQHVDEIVKVIKVGSTKTKIKKKCTHFQIFSAITFKVNIFAL